MNKIYVARVWMDGDMLIASTADGMTAKYDLSKLKGFKHATPQQLNNFVVEGEGIHWPELDEDINLEGMFYDNHLCDLTATEDSVIYRPLPEDCHCAAEPLPQKQRRGRQRKPQP